MGPPQRRVLFFDAKSASTRNAEADATDSAFITAVSSMPKVNVGPCAAKFDAEIKAYVASASAQGSAPLLVSFLGNDDPEALVYAKMTRRACESNGVRFELRQVDKFDLESQVIAANSDPNVHGILVYYPVFGGSVDDYLRDVISLEKDVEGLNHRYRYSMYHNIRTLDGTGRKCVLPCTPLAVVKIMEHLGAYDRGRPVGHQLDGKVAAVFNRSEVVGRPLAAMLANDGATVYSVDVTGMLVYTRGSVAGTIRVAETTAERKEVLARADLLVTAVPLPPEKFVVKASELKKGVIAINLAQHANLEPAVADVGTLVPAIGKVTIAMLQRNLLRLHDNFDPHGRCMSPPLRATPGADLDEADASGKRARAYAAAAAALGVAAFGALAIAARRAK